MKAIIYISGRITKDETLVDVIRQYKSYETPSEVEVRIKSNGGNKDEGNAVYSYLKNIDTEIPVTTITDKAFSIGAKIFASGRFRLVSDKEEVLGVHFARVTPKGTYTAEEVEELANEMFVIKKEFIDFYSEHLDIDEETVSNLLENETILSGKEAIELGFATGFEIIKEEIVAELDFEQLNNDKMKDSKKKGFLKGFLADVSAYLESEEVIAELTLQDSNGSDVVFPDLEEDGTPKVGDSATMDGKAIEDGSYVMPSIEDSTVVFVGGKITEINAKEAEEETEEVTAEEIKEVFTYSVEAVSTTFNEGDTLTLKHTWDDSEFTAGAGEFKLKDGSTIVTDASGVIVSVKSKEEAVIEVDGTEGETEAYFEEVIGKLTKKVKTEVSADFEAKFKKQEAEIKALKAKKGSKEITAEQKEVDGGKAKTKGGRAGQILGAR